MAFNTKKIKYDSIFKMKNRTVSLNKCIKNKIQVRTIYLVDATSNFKLLHIVSMCLAYFFSRIT